MVALSILGLTFSLSMLSIPSNGGLELGARELGSKRELFVDAMLIESLDSAELRLHSPRPAEIALRLDRPWEGLFCGYFTVIEDGDVYRMYYRGLPDLKKEEVTCMAESTDGIVWKRPNLGLYEVEGTRENNVVLKGEGCHNLSPFVDTRPGVSSAERYKALGSMKGGLAAFASSDGIHWEKMSDRPALTHERHGEFDSQNVSFWSESEQRYVCYYRKFVNGIRSIARATSNDFLDWSDGHLMDREVVPRNMDHLVRRSNGEPLGDAEALAHHLYTNQTHPYFRAPHIYLSFPMRFCPRRRALGEGEVRAIQVHSNYGADASDGVFMTTRGDTKYHYFPEAFQRPGPDPGNWVSRTNMAALGIVPTGPDEISVYYSQHYAQPSHHIRRFVLRTDGFVSVNAPFSGGEMTTKPFRFTGNRLSMNYSTSAAGTLRVELQDAGGKPVPGFSLDECPVIFGDRIDGTIAWRGGSDVSALSGKVVRLRLVMTDVDVYSFRFISDADED